MQLGAIGLSKYLVNRNEYYTMQVVIDKIDQMSAEQIAEFDAMQ